MTVPVSPSGIAPRTIRVEIGSEQIAVGSSGVWINFSVGLPEDINEEVSEAVKAAATAIYESLSASFPNPPAVLYGAVAYDGTWDTAPDTYPFA